MNDTKCKTCKNTIKSTDKICEYCGTPNENYKSGQKVYYSNPQTIEQFKDWFAEQGLPPATAINFHIGEHVKTPKAIGIYKENNMTTMYMNDSNGEPNVFFQDTNEALVVETLCNTIKENIIHSNKSSNKRLNKLIWGTVIVFIVLIICVIIRIFT